MTRSPAILIAAGLALGGLAAGCGSGDAGSGEPVPALTAAEEETLRQASERLIARCMGAHGFAYAEQPPPVVEPEFRYVLDDVSWARQHGYGPLTGRRDEPARDVNDGNLAALTPTRRKSWQYRLMGAGRSTGPGVTRRRTDTVRILRGGPRRPALLPDRCVTR